MPVPVYLDLELPNYPEWDAEAIIQDLLALMPDMRQATTTLNYKVAQLVTTAERRGRVHGYAEGRTHGYNVGYEEGHLDARDEARFGR